MTYASPQNQIIASFGASDRAKEKLTTLSHTGKPWGQSEHRRHILLVKFLVNQSTLLSGHRIGASISKNTVFEMSYNSLNLMKDTF